MIDILLNKYNMMPAAVRASFWFTVSSVLLKGISFITLPIFSRILSPEEYGTIYVYSTWVSIIVVFSTLSLWCGVFKVSIARFHGNKSRIVAAYQGLALTATVIIGMFFIFFMHSAADMFDIPDILVIIIFVEILTLIPWNMWMVSEQFDYKYRAIVILTLVNGVLIPLFSYIGIMLFPENKAEAKIIGGLIPQIIESLIIGGMNFFKGGIFYDKALWKFGFTFNVVLIPHYLSGLILNQSDRIMIKKMCGGTDVGLYGMAYTFAMLITLFSNAIESSFTPHIYKSLAREDVEKLPRQSNIIILTLACVMAIMICFIPDVFTLVLPEEYYEAIWVFPPVITGILFMFMYSMFGAVEFYYKENKFVTIASCLGAVLNIALNYIFIDIFGYIAAAYTTLGCYILFAVGHYIFMNIVLKKNSCNYKLYDVHFIGIISVLLVLFSLVMEVLYINNYARWGMIGVLSVVLYSIKDNLIFGIKQMKQ